MSLNHPKSQGPNQTLSIVAIILLTFALMFCLFLLIRNPNNTTHSTFHESALQRIERTGVLRAGYAGFPPYIIVNPKESDPNKRVIGFDVDMVNEIAKRHQPPLKVEWYNANWDTLKADMLSNRFDFLAEPVYETVPRAAEIAYCEPYSYFGIAVAVVRKNDNRFKVWKDLDRPDITISYAQGYVSGEYAKQHLTKPKFKSITVGKDAFVQLDDVLFNHSDVGLQDVPTVVQYVKAHRDKVKALWLEKPPSTVAASFITRMEDRDLRDFLSACIRIMRVDGTLSRLDKKWKSLGHFERIELVPGEGIRELSAKSK